MTPEGSQSSEELLNVETPSSSSSSMAVQIRVKNVSEINSNEAEAEANPSPPPKRKLPKWMLLSSQQQDSVGNKKRKTVSKNIECASTSSAVDDQPGSSVIASPASNGIQADAELNNSSADVNEDIADAGRREEVLESIETGTSEESGVEPLDSASVGASTSNGQSSSSTVAVKNEPIDKEDDNMVVGHITPTSPRDIKPAVKVEKEEATSSTNRVSCKFGIRCYRQNPMHRREEAHPGDKDYRRPDFPQPPDGTPDCPFGNLCYRRNPVHFQQYSHPPLTDFEQNWKNKQLRLRQRKQPNYSYSDLEDDYDLEDPFFDDDTGDEFIPNDGDDDEDDYGDDDDEDDYGDDDEDDDDFE